MPEKATAQEQAVKKEAGPAINAEIISSPGQVNSGSLNLGLGKTNITGFFYGSESYDVGALEASWELGRFRALRLPRWLGIAPGIGGAAIRNKTVAETAESHSHHERPAETISGYRSVEPVATLTFRAESRRFVSEGTVLWTMLATHGHRNYYSDGAHASVRIKGWETGFTAALSNHYIPAENKIEQERLRGIRIARKLSRGFSALGMVLWPGKPVWRFGLAYKTPEEH